MAEVHFSRLAGHDLDVIRLDGEATFGEEPTRRHLRGFDRIFARLRTHPRSGQERPELGSGIRTFSHRPHRVLYRIDDDVVTVLRILHTAQDTRRIVLQ